MVKHPSITLCNNAYDCKERENVHNYRHKRVTKVHFIDKAYV